VNEQSPPTPSQLFRLFEAGLLSREDLQTSMAVHAGVLIDEIEQVRQNPVAANIDGLLSRLAADRLVKKYGELLVREVLVALAEVPDFPPANLLWNAGHWDVPLRCFVRTRFEPVFRVMDFRPIGHGDPGRAGVRITVEYGRAPRRKATRERLTVRRDPSGRFFWETRHRLR